MWTGQGRFRAGYKRKSFFFINKNKSKNLSDRIGTGALTDQGREQWRHRRALGSLSEGSRHCGQLQGTALCIVQQGNRSPLKRKGAPEKGTPQASPFSFPVS